MGSSPQDIAFLHGIGQSPDAWRGVINALPEHLHGFTAPIDLVPHPGPFTLERAAIDLANYLDGQELERVHVCGLSLGAMIAVQFATDFPQRIAGLALSGGPVHPNPALMAIQRFVIQILPARLACPPGLDKPAFLSVLDAVADTDLSEALAALHAPTLVLCGSRDRPNLAAAREIARLVPGAVLDIVPEAGHEWNLHQPEQFASRLARFVATS